MPHLDVPGAKLYYESMGEGPLLLCISGGNGDADPWRPLSHTLKKDFTVVCYDRRGFSRSALTDTQDYSQRLARDADDAAALITALSPDETPVTVIGSSSGAIVALELLTRHADLVSTVFAHEGPLFRYLPDFDELWPQQQHIYDTYRAGGLIAGMRAFAELVQMKNDEGAMIAMLTNSANPYRAGNMTYWMERELLTYVKREWKREDLERTKGKLVLLLGNDSPEGALQYRGNVELGKLLDLKPEVVSGEHFGYASHCKEFAGQLREILAAR